MILSELILMVEELCSVSVSLEIIDDSLSECRNLRLPQDQYIHHSEVCRRNKLADFSVCLNNKRRSREIARHGRAFSGKCPKGVWDLAVPVQLNRKTVAIVYLGGVLVPPDEAKRKKLYSYGRFIAQFIVLELLRQAKLTGEHRKRRSEPFYIDNCVRFLEEHFGSPVSLGDLAETLNVNPNYLGKLLKRHFGKSFHQLLCERRLKQSEVLLSLHHALNITEIAGLCGFSDSNYFSTVFRHHFGISPREYRTLHQAKKPVREKPSPNGLKKSVRV